MDWGEIWRTVEKVTEEEWRTENELKQTYLMVDRLSSIQSNHSMVYHEEPIGNLKRGEMLLAF